MKRFWTVYKTEQKLGFRSVDSIFFGVCMPIGILVLIALIAGDKMAGEGNYTFLQSAFASLISVGICASAFMGIPLTITDYRDKKILKHFFVTPCSPLLLLGAVVACAVVTAVLSGLTLTLVSVLALGYRMKGNVFEFIGAFILVMTSMYSIGMLIASLCRTVKMVNIVTTAVYFPMLFLSGATIPFEIFPKGLQNVASVLPLTQGIKLMKEISIGNPVENVTGIVVLLAVITVICCGLSIGLFRWE